MSNALVYLLGILQITFLDLALCGDNIGVIALATRNLSEKRAKTASIIGILGAIALRIYFACILTVFFKFKWLPIKLVGGLLLVKVTWDLIKPQHESEDHMYRNSENFWDAVLAVILADISMSLDNVLAIASAAQGDFSLIFFGILLNIPIIFFGSQIVVNLMRKYPITIYIGGAILAYTSVNMILEDYWFHKYNLIPKELSLVLPWAAAITALGYGLHIIKKSKKDERNTIKKVS